MMPAATDWRFGSFRVDVRNECVWRGEQALKLTPKAFAVLQYLLEHAGQLVTKDALWQAVWQGVLVTDAALTMCVTEIRKAFGDNAKTPQFIETVHRRGYRWIAPPATTPPVASSQLSVFSTDKAGPKSPRLATDLWPLTTPFVGREMELQQLHGWLEKALRGERQLGFVTGEAGIGKTTLVETFLQSLEFSVQRLASENRDVSLLQTLAPRLQTLDSRLWIGHGQCIEQFGAGEAYLPLLAAFGQLCRAPSHEQALSVLSQYAPTWLVQLPALVSPSDFEGLQRRTSGATRERMLREMAEALEALTTVHPLVLVLEDLHWSDPSTLELLSFLARRRQVAQLLIIGTYRPVEVLANGHPLRAVTQELQLHRHCEVLPLQLLSEDDIAQYLANRFPAGAAGRSPLRPLAQAIHRRTEGNPLFMVNVVEDLLTRGVLDGSEIAVSTPTTIQQLIERQIDHLTPAEQEVLAVASVAGIEFSAAAVAAGTGSDTAEVETRCADLARREHFLRRSGSSVWPDGTVAACSRFQHALYQEVVYERVTMSRRGTLHLRIGERLETAYGERSTEIAAELAVHFEQGRDHQRAVRYLQQAAENAIQRSAYVEANTHLAKGLELLKTLPDTPERIQQDLGLQTTLSLALVFTKGFAAPEVEAVVRRMQELCQQISETPQRLAVLGGLWSVQVTRAEHQTALELAEQFLTLAQSVQHPIVSLAAHYNLGWSLLFTGKFALAREHQEQCLALYNPQQHHSLAIRHTSFDYGIASQSVGALTLWHLGYPEQALKMSRTGLTLAQELAHPFSLVVALISAAAFHQHRREGQAVQEQAEAVIALCGEQGFVFYLAQGTILRGWALAVQGQGEEGIAQIRQGIAAYRATGAGVHLPYFLALLAEAYGKGGQTEEGSSVLAQALALVDKTGERYYEAELYRLKGQLTLEARGWRLEPGPASSQPPHEVKVKSGKLKIESGKSKVKSGKSLIPNAQEEVEREAEECFLKAIEISQKQQAKSLELRATMSLARLWQQQGRQREAYDMLAAVYHWFTEGFDTKDLQEAKALLEALNH
jgi:DNA-binding winged helix-turn-helix (wHTH) protein/predicted ATPase